MMNTLSSLKKSKVVNYMDYTVKNTGKKLFKNHNSIKKFKEELKQLPHPKLSQEKASEIINTQKGIRPDPTVVYSKSDIETHLHLFDSGVVKFAKEDDYYTALKN